MIFKRLRLRRPAVVRISSKLIVTYLLLTVIPISLLGYISYYQYTQSVKEQFGEYMPGYLSLASGNIEKRLEEYMNMPELIYSSNDIVTIMRKTGYENRSEEHQDRFVVNNYLTRTYMNGNYPDIIGVFVEANSQLFYSSRLTINSSGLDVIQRLAKQNRTFDEQRRNANIILPGEIDVSFEGDVPFIMLMKPIADFDNRKNLGTMYIAIKISFIHNILAEIENKFQANVWVTNNVGRIIYHTDGRQIGQIDEEISRYPVLTGSFQADLPGQTQIISVHQMPSYNWILVHSIPAKALTERTDMVKNFTVLIFIIFVLITTVLSILLALNISRPIKKLSSLMKVVEIGNFQVDLQIKNRDEIGLLARSFNSMISKIRELVEKNYYIEIKQREAELYALQAQINPHFMYNTLQTIGAAVEEEESEEVIKMVMLLGRILRYSLSNESKLVRISEEVRHVEDYLTIQKFRFEDRVRFDIDTRIETEQWLTPKFILQPVVENSIKYGLEHRKGVRIHILINKEFSAKSGGDNIVFRIRDDGPGIPPDRLLEVEQMLKAGKMAQGETGVGLKNVHARIAIMFSEFYGLEIHSMHMEGTEITIRIPLITAESTNHNEDGKGAAGFADD